MKGLQWGVWSPNEIRTLEDENPRAGGDVYYPPPNMTAPAGPDEQDAGLLRQQKTEEREP